MSVDLDELTNRQVGNYRCLTRIAAGGMGVIWRAEALRGRQSAAIKFLRPEHVCVRRERAAFQREIKILAALRHPRLLQVLGRGAFEGIPYAVFEYFPSSSLKSLLAPDTRAQVLTRAFKIIVQIGEALDYIHHHGIVHRDVKPENILVADNGDAKLIDFSAAVRGIARWFPFFRRAVGSPTYMAPEQLRQKAVGPAADIYAFGAVIYEMLAGRPPHVGETQDEMLSRKINSDPSPVSRYNRRVTPGLDKCVLAMLSRSPADRPATMASVTRTLTKEGIFL